MLEDAGTEGLDQRVGGVEQAQHGLAPLLRLEVDRHAALVTPEQRPPRRAVVQHAAHVPRRVAGAGALDLDHLGPEITEQRPHGRPGDDVRQLDDADAVER
jgi:hypothetical protein